MKLNKKHLPLFAAFVQTAQYSLAGYFLIGAMGWFFVGLMGALISLAMAYATSQVSDIAQKRKAGAYVALVAIMVFSPVIIGTATYLHLTQIVNPYWRGIVSAAWGFLPDGAVALAGFVAGKGMIEQERKPKVAGKKQGKTGKSPKVAGNIAGKMGRKRVKDAELLAFFQQHPGASHQDAADYFEVSRQAIGPRVKKLYEVKQ